MNHKLFAYLFTVLSLSLPQLSGAAVTNGLETVTARRVYEAKVEKPNHLSLCLNRLWTYSESQQKLIALDPKTGAYIQSFDINAPDIKDRPQDIAAISCRGQKLLVLLNSKSNQARILELSLNETTNQKSIVTAAASSGIQILNQFKVPQKSRAKDLFCNLQKCWLLQDKPFVTSDFKKWTAIEIPDGKTLKLTGARPDLNPFEDWQATLILAESSYAKGAVNTAGQTILLDPFRVQFAIESGNSWTKWGTFGAWEGYLLSPKVITFISADQIAVADAKLKVVSIFSLDGQYSGVLALDQQTLFSPDYPLGLTSDGRNLYVADFGANRITAFELPDVKAALQKVSTSVHVRKNLFRREEVLNDSPSSLCLKCHDGTVTNQLFKYIKLPVHHPLECSQCHEPHHKSKQASFLRLPEQELCQSCHKDYVDPKTNHTWQQKDKKGGRCIDCHRSHANSEKLLVAPKSELCLNCHKDKSFKHNSIEQITFFDAKNTTVLDNGNLVCQTCHQTHINWRDTHFIKTPAPILNSCSSCHGDKSPTLFKEFHQRINPKKRTK